MGMPVKLSDELVLSARIEAEGADRSITAQIEHWAKLGRAAEVALGYTSATALKLGPMLDLSRNRTIRAFRLDAGGEHQFV